jgi:hypothetical protein
VYNASSTWKARNERALLHELNQLGGGGGAGDSPVPWQRAPPQANSVSELTSLLGRCQILIVENFQNANRRHNKTPGLDVISVLLSLCDLYQSLKS